jgi:lipopolysaccharide heptosyltransferase II
MKFLIIQTAFIGDVILATAIAEKLHQHYPDAQIDFLLRKGNEGLLTEHPFIKTVFVWDKQNNKIKNLFTILKQIRSNRYDHVINLHRFASSGFITAFSGAKNKTGFDKNPLSFLFTKKTKHDIGTGKHEVERNQQLIGSITDFQFSKPKLYPSLKNFESVKQYKNNSFVCIAPTSVWFTKQFPKEKWVELCNYLSKDLTIYLLGAPSDTVACEEIKNNSANKNIVTLAGKLNFLESAALMKDAQMNYVNDSAPMHIASAMNAPVTAIFCSTIPAFGFGPLSDNSKIVETKEALACRPCGLHGHKTCPEGHFKCAYSIEISETV